MLIFLVFFQTLGDYGISLLASMLLHVSLKCLEASIHPLGVVPEA